MPRAVKITTDDAWTVIDLKTERSLHDEIGAYFDLQGLTPAGLEDFPYIAIAVDDEGHYKKLKRNRLATSLGGVFVLQQLPLVGPAVVLAANYEGETVDLPEWVIDLIRALATVAEIIEKGIKASRRG